MNHSNPPTRPRGRRSAAASSGADAEGKGRAASAGHILVVDDDPEIRKIIALLLSGAGYRVDCAADGEAGWDALCADSFDLLIIDHEMPKLTGLELLRRVRAGPLHLPAIMISGFMPSGEADLEWLLRSGAAMEKPFMFGALLAKVRELLNGSPAGSPTVSMDGLQLSLRES
jgi:DNA-binding response OmpR family regulator